MYHFSLDCVLENAGSNMTWESGGGGGGCTRDSYPEFRQVWFKQWFDHSTNHMTMGKYLICQMGIKCLSNMAVGGMK